MNSEPTGERPGTQGIQSEFERLRDLVRYARHFLFEENLISQDEYAALVMDSDQGERVARLESYDKLRRKMMHYRAEAESARNQAGIELDRLRASLSTIKTLLESHSIEFSGGLWLIRHASTTCWSTFRSFQEAITSPAAGGPQACESGELERLRARVGELGGERDHLLEGIHLLGYRADFDASRTGTEPKCSKCGCPTRGYPTRSSDVFVAGKGMETDLSRHAAADDCIDRLRARAGELERSLELRTSAPSRAWKACREMLEQRIAELEAANTRLLNIARGCHDYGGGYKDKREADVYHHGIQTVINALEAAAKGDSFQLRALESVGMDAARRQAIRQIDQEQEIAVQLQQRISELEAELSTANSILRERDAHVLRLIREKGELEAALKSATRYQQLSEEHRDFWTFICQMEDVARKAAGETEEEAQHRCFDAMSGDRKSVV